MFKWVLCRRDEKLQLQEVLVAVQIDAKKMTPKMPNILVVLFGVTLIYLTAEGKSLVKCYIFF